MKKYEKRICKKPGKVFENYLEKCCNSMDIYYNKVISNGEVDCDTHEVEMSYAREVILKKFQMHIEQMYVYYGNKIKNKKNTDGNSQSVSSVSEEEQEN